MHSATELEQTFIKKTNKQKKLFHLKRNIVIKPLPSVKGIGPPVAALLAWCLHKTRQGSATDSVEEQLVNLNVLTVTVITTCTML